jgi:hypothetical protein
VHEAKNKEQQVQNAAKNEEQQVWNAAENEEQQVHEAEDPDNTSVHMLSALAYLQMYMLHPNPEFVHFQNRMKWEAIPNWNFHNRMFGMVSQSIQFFDWTNSCLGSNIYV